MQNSRWSWINLASFARRIQLRITRQGANALGLLALGVAFALPVPRALARGGSCPTGMQRVEGKFCIDAYEASLVELLEGGLTRPHPPYEPVDGKRVRAVSRRGRFPQGYISRNEAEAACEASHKRLCRDREWVQACKGPAATRYPYGNARREGVCNDTGAVSPLNHYFGAITSNVDPYTWEAMNDPRLNQLAGALVRSGEKRQCKSGYGIYDMVGNLHEWTTAAAGTFRGGYYLDTKINGEGCEYQTVAHNATYHDYSTGFRCCADTD